MKPRRFFKPLLAVFVLWITASCFLITTPRGPIKFDPPVLPDAQVGVPYEAILTISGNVTPAIGFSTAKDALPKGLTLEKIGNEDRARISGTPQEAGTFKFKIFVWCYGTNVSGQEAEKEYSITVK